MLDNLPGKLAHEILMPFPERLNELPSDDHTKAAVLIALRYNEGKLEFPLILRNPGASKDPHRGQIGLPGGRFDKNDPNLVFTALRETHEEIGIPAEHIKIVGALSPLYIPVSKNLVYPFIGYTETHLEYTLQRSEIMELFHCSVDTLKDRNIITKRIINTSYAKDIAVPGFEIADRWIWGATAMILSEFKEILDSCIE